MIGIPDSTPGENVVLLSQNEQLSDISYYAVPLHARLRKLAKYCEFVNLESEIKSHLIQECTSSRLRRRALTEPEMMLANLLIIARAMELTERQTKVIESGNTQGVAAIRRHDNKQQRLSPPFVLVTTNNKGRGNISTLIRQNEMRRRNKLAGTAVKTTCTPVDENHVQRLVRTAEHVRNRTTSQPAADPKSN